MVHREEAEIRDNLCVRNDKLYVKYQWSPNDVEIMDF